MNNKLSLQRNRLFVAIAIAICLVSVAIFGSVGKSLRTNAYDTDVDLTGWETQKLWDFDDPFYQQLSNNGADNNGYYSLLPDVWWDNPPHIVIAEVPDGAGGKETKSVFKMEQTITGRFWSNLCISGAFLEDASYEFKVVFKHSLGKNVGEDGQNRQKFDINLSRWEGHNVFSAENIENWVDLGDGWYEHTAVIANGGHTDLNLILRFDTWGGWQSILISDLSLRKVTGEGTFGENIYPAIPQLTKQRMTYWIDSLTNKGYPYDGMHSWGGTNYAEIVTDPTDANNQVMHFGRTNNYNISNIEIRFGHQHNTDYKISFKFRLSDNAFNGIFGTDFVAADFNGANVIANRSNWVELGNDWYLFESVINSKQDNYALRIYFDNLWEGNEYNVWIDDLKVEKITFDKRGLLAKINEAEGLVETDFTPSSWASADLEDALGAAKTVLDNVAAVQTEINEAYGALNTAIATLQVRGDITALTGYIAENDLDDIYEDDQALYVTTSWPAFKTAYETAIGLIADPEVGQTDLDNALEALTTAFNGLVLKADFTALNAYITTNGLDALVTAGNGGKYSEESWDLFKAAYDAAKAVVADNPQSVVDAALTELKDTFEALSVDKDALSAYIEGEDLNNLASTGYTTSSFAAFEQALEDALDILESATAIQSEIDEALETLTTAYNGLVLVGNKTALSAYIAEHELATLVEADYSAGWADFKTAYDAAVAVVSSNDVTQAQVDAALTTLKAKHEALVEKVEEPPANNKSCFGTVNSTSVLLLVIVILALGATLIIKKREEN